MNARCHDLRIVAIWALVLALPALAACGTAPATSPPANVVIVLGTPVVVINDRQNQAAATAEIERANAQATLNSANATLSAAQIQQQNSEDVIAAQIAAEAAIVRANAQATLVAASSTQYAAQTQDAYQQTQVQEQQNRDAIAANTQTAVANLIATQTQSALATSQWYEGQTRQLQEQGRSSIAFLWIWCLPLFILILAGLALWGFWRWLKIRQANQHILENPVEIIDHRQDDSSRYLEGEVNDRRYRLTKPVDQARRWLDDVKRKMRSSDRKNEDDDTDN